MDKSKYYFCYSPTQHKFIHKNYKLEYICAALNEKDLRKFWLYEKSEQLSEALTQYRKLFKGGDLF